MASSVATPLERQFGRIAGVTEMTSTSSLGSTNITLQFDLDRNIDAAARDVQAAINAARGQLPANLPNNPYVPQGQPGRRADHDPVADLRHRTTARGCTTSRPPILQQKLAQVRRRRPGHRRRRRAAGRARRRQPDGAQQQRPRARGRPHGARAPPTRTGPRASSATSGTTWSLSHDRPAPQGRRVRAADRRTTRTARPCGSPTSRSVTDSVEDIRTGGLSNGKPAVILIIFRQPGANIIETVDRIRGAAAAARRRRSRRRSTLGVVDRRTTHDPRLGARRRDHAR